MTEIHAYFDGAFIWGDNHCGYGALVKRGREILFSEYKYVGNGSKMSVNVAEYSGLIAVLKFLISAEISEPVLVRGDSKLVIKQMQRKWRIKEGSYIPFCQQAILLSLKLPNVKYGWIPREHNGEADELAKSSLMAFYGQSRRDSYDRMFEDAIAKD